MKNLNIIIILISLYVLTGCVMQATLVDISSGVTLKAKFTDNSGTGGKCQVQMPDGEILIGKYSGIRGTDEISFSNAVGKINSKTEYNYSGLNSNTNGTYSLAGSTRTVGGQGKAYAILTSTKPGSTLVMEIISIYNVVSGGGFGDAKTNDGRVYKVIF
jgi:hypothetical protein